MGGAESMLVKLVQAWSKRHDIDSTVINLGQGNDNEARLRRAGAKVINATGALKYSPSLLPRVSNLLKLSGPDIVQGWMYHGNLFAYHAANKTGSNAPVVWNIRHTIKALKHERTSTRAAIYWSARQSAKVSAIVYNARAGLQTHSELGFRNNNSFVIPNGFDSAVFTPDRSAYEKFRQEHELPQDQIVVGHVARYHPHKDHRTFIQAAARLDIQNVTFAMLGENVDYGNQELMRQIQALGMEGNILLLGKVDNVHEITAAFDIAVSSSITEGFSNAIGEALCCGVPCVATNVGDSMDLVGEAGIIVEAQRPDYLADALKNLILNPKRQSLGTKGRQRIVDTYSINIIADRYISVYRQQPRT